MRYYQIAHSRHAPLLRWSYFPRRRAWLDVTRPRCHVVLHFMGEGVHDVALGVRDRNGRPVPSQIETPEEVPETLPLFPAQPEARRRLTALGFDFPGPRPLEIVDTRTGDVLMRLVPQILVPTHVFALMEEARTGILPGGFAPDGFEHFIETGTLFGHTTLHASYWARNVVTIELSEALHREAVAHLAHRPNVTCLQGNSADRLPGVIAAHPGTAFYFLDAHWSGDSGTAWDGSRFAGYPVDTARIDDPTLSEGERQVPLGRELEQIAEAHRGRAAILIDDWGGVGQTDFGFNGEDWSHLDARALLDWMERHPRHMALTRVDPMRYAWFIE